MAHLLYLSKNPKVGTYYADGSPADSGVKIPTLAIFLPIIFIVVSIYLAYRNKMGAWGYVGFIALGSLVGYGISSALIVNANKELIEKS